MNMKSSILFIIKAAVVATAVLAISQPDSSAQQRHKLRPVEILDGTTVLLGTPSGNQPTPIESRLGDSGLDFPPDRTVYLYPLGQMTAQGIVENGVAVTEGPAVANGLTGPEKPTGKGFIGNVTDSARVDLYFPERPNGQMVICAPGGGYGGLSIWNEGSYVAKWMNDRGITCAVVKYRLPNGHREVPLQDMQNAFRYCRYHAAEWDVKQIGVIGFSAGGHLATTVETMYSDSLTKPDFAVLIYPVVSFRTDITHMGTHDNLIGKTDAWGERDEYSFEQWYWGQLAHRDLEELYSSERNVTAWTPPTFIAVSTDDRTVPVINSVLFYQALVKHQVPTELHIYPYGGHGWGFSDSAIGIDPSLIRDNLQSCRTEFSRALERWLAGLRADGAPVEEPTPAPADFSIPPSRTVHLYPDGQLADHGIDGITSGPGVSNGATGEEVVDDALRFRNVGDSARFDLYFPEDSGLKDSQGKPLKRNGRMVVVCPGGGYLYSSQRGEGQFVADWFLRQGISVAVVNYRMPCGQPTVPLTDIQNVFRYCRHHAQEWGIRSVGIIGFSAGGHLAATASTLFVDAVTRPDFSILIYPVITMDAAYTHRGSRENLIGTAKDKVLIRKYSLENQVKPEVPPTFIALSSDDKTVPPENTIRYYNALVECGVTCEMHSFPTGGHGWGFRTARFGKDSIQPYRSDFFASLSRFLRELPE